MAVIHGLSGARVDVHAENRHLIVLSRLLVHLLGRGILAIVGRLRRVGSSGINRLRGIILRENCG
jgi:hypothetical protein